MCSIADSEAVEMGLHYNRELRFISKTHQDKKENQGFQNKPHEDAAAAVRGENTSGCLTPRGRAGLPLRPEGTSA